VYSVEYTYFQIIILCNSVGTVLGIGLYGRSVARTHAAGR
jgi:hypothetical protein